MNHFYEGIPGWFGFADIYREAVERAPRDRPSHFLEIGAWKGRSTAFMAVEIINSGKPITLWVVDHWLGSNEPAHQDDKDVMNGALFSTFCRNMLDGGVLDELNILRIDSSRVSYLFPQKFDFCFIDGAHDAESVGFDIGSCDIASKEKAVIAGDDYGWASVREAVDARCIPEVRGNSWLVGGWSNGVWK